jgi:hypothetical protein
MTTRADIIGPEGFTPGVKGRLIYTCNCGWIDLGHANPAGARSLISEVRAAAAKPGGGIVVYGQSAHGISLSHGWYYVRGGLSPAEQDSVALGIYQRVTEQFESAQGLVGSDSSFSQEDLVSNLIGFHAAATGEKVENLVRAHCGKILSKAEAESVWDQTGGVGANRNRKWEPLIQPCEACKQACPEERRFPSEFGRIRPAQPGQGYSLL